MDNSCIHLAQLHHRCCPDAECPNQLIIRIPPQHQQHQQEQQQRRKRQQQRGAMAGGLWESSLSPLFAAPAAAALVDMVSVTLDEPYCTERGVQERAANQLQYSCATAQTRLVFIRDSIFLIYVFC